MGKTSLVKHIKNELILRKVYSDGVHYFDLKKIRKRYALNGGEYSQANRQPNLINNDNILRRGGFLEEEIISEKTRKKRFNEKSLFRSLTINKCQIHLKKAICTHFGESFEQNVKKFLKKKNILFIFDNYELIDCQDPQYRHKETKNKHFESPKFIYPKYLFKAFQEEIGVHILLLTEYKLENVPTGFELETTNDISSPELKDIQLDGNQTSSKRTIDFTKLEEQFSESENLEKKEMDTWCHELLPLSPEQAITLVLSLPSHLYINLKDPIKNIDFMIKHQFWNKYKDSI